MKLDTVEVEGKNVGVMSIYVKSLESDRIGAGHRIEVFETGNFMCPIKAFLKYRAIYQWRKDDESPVFREENGECLTGKKLNDYLDDISVELKEKGILVGNHSFRAGVA